MSVRKAKHHQIGHWKHPAEKSWAWTGKIFSRNRKWDVSFSNVQWSRESWPLGRVTGSLAGLLARPNHLVMAALTSLSWTPLPGDTSCQCGAHSFTRLLLKARTSKLNKTLVLCDNTLLLVYKIWQLSDGRLPPSAGVEFSGSLQHNTTVGSRSARSCNRHMCCVVYVSIGWFCFLGSFLQGF